jgi:hypothetical protein
MVNRKRTKGQTMAEEILQKQLKIERHETHQTNPMLH